jgi:hypothetical protein
VVKEVPATGETISRDGTVASFKETKMGVVSVAVEAVGFALMTE